MANVLNLTLKKEVAEGLLNGNTHDIKLDKNAYWSKRLLEDPKAKPDDFVFKPFDTVSISYGSETKLVYPITGMRGNTSAFYITVEVPVAEEAAASDEAEKPVDEAEAKAAWDAMWKQAVPVVEEPAPVQADDETEDEVEDKDESLEPAGVNPVVVEKVDEAIVVKQVKKPVAQAPAPKPAPVKKESVEEKIDKMLTDFCKKRDVIEVNIPVVRISHDGKVFGYNKVINTLGRTETTLNMEPKRIMHFYDMDDDAFVSSVRTMLNKMLIGNAVFIWKSKCKYKVNPNGHRILTLYMNKQRITGKMYM